jgi:hypothetical protein
MNLKAIFPIAFMALAFVGCDDTTETVGNSLNKNNSFVATTDSFLVASNTVLVDSVLSKNTVAYLGYVRDPETGSYITGDAMIQLHSLADIGLPAKDSIVSKLGNEVIADSCELFLPLAKSYGDSTVVMTLNLREMQKPMLETRTYYTNFDPEANGYLRTTNGINKDASYTLASKAGTSSGILIRMNDKYWDKNGKEYNNLGTYLLQIYYAHPEYFKNTYSFLTNVFPGFYFKHKSGLGAMAHVESCLLNIFYRSKVNGKDSAQWISLVGTEEVLQHTKVTNTAATATLLNDTRYTYLKTPAGFFTQLTIPVEQLENGHNGQDINQVKLSVPRVNNSTTSDNALSPSSSVLLLPVDSLNSFFKQNVLMDNKVSFLGSLVANTYTFDNIANVINVMRKADKTNPNWNKLVIVPVTLTTTTRQTQSGSNETVITKITHNMSLTSTKLLKGTGAPGSAIKLNVIYTKVQ